MDKRCILNGIAVSSMFSLGPTVPWSLNARSDALLTIILCFRSHSLRRSRLYQSQPSLMWWRGQSPARRLKPRTRGEQRLWNSHANEMAGVHNMFRRHFKEIYRLADGYQDASLDLQQFLKYAANFYRCAFAAGQFHVAECSHFMRYQR